MSFGVFLMGFGEDEAELEPEAGVFNWRAVRGVAGLFLGDTSKSFSFSSFCVSELLLCVLEVRCREMKMAMEKLFWMQIDGGDSSGKLRGNPHLFSVSNIIYSVPPFLFVIPWLYKCCELSPLYADGLLVGSLVVELEILLWVVRLVAEPEILLLEYMAVMLVFAVVKFC
ncbi:hypothetical protein RYX36_010864 [Vicia faba]